MLMGRKPPHKGARDKTQEEIWEITLEEAEKGWLEGPYTEKEVSEKFGPLFVASPRFGLVQSDKIRPIDDMSVSLVNSSFSAGYALDLDGVDGVAILARSFLECVSEGASVAMRLSDGAYLCGSLHESFSVEEARTLCGRTLDLESAYKQMLVKESSLWASILLVDDASGQKHFFVSQVLPFGVAAAVYSFNRIARAIQRVGIALLRLVWCNYYDDYPQLDLQCNGSASQEAAERFLDLIVWRYSTKSSKRIPMAPQFAVLGVEFDFSFGRAGRILVRNKQSSVDQICSDICEILAGGVFTAASASSLRGRLQFAESQTFGRAVALHMRHCHLRASGGMPGHFLNEEIRQELQWAMDFVANSPPRVLRVRSSEEKVLIFTDASLEDSTNLAGVGMVAVKLLRGEIVHKVFFSEEVPHDVLEAMQVKTQKVISALELLAAVMSFEVLAQHLSERRVFIFVDNESARANLISMYSPVLVQSMLLRFMFRLCRDKSIYSWVSRVPSMSNPADAPSRFKDETLIRQGFRKVRPSWLAVAEILKQCANVDGRNRVG